MAQTNTVTHTFDENRALAFGETVGDIINSGAIAVMMSIGHRTGLFDTMADMPPSTSADIAKAAVLSERHVREWLAAMVTGGIIEFTPASGTYYLPAEHASCLTREATPGNFAVYAQIVSLLGSVQEPILECFRTGEGTSYSDYPCFHTIMAEDSGQTVVAALFDHVLPLALGLDERLQSGIDVLDAGCGAGRALIALAGQYPNSRFTGYDLCADAIAMATGEAASSGLSNIVFRQVDMTDFDEPDRYDFVTSFDAVHDQKAPEKLIRSIHSALRPGGTYLMQDVGGSAHLENNKDFPFAAFLYAVSCLHCMPVSLGQDGDGLGTMWGWETAQELLSKAGFSTLDRHVLDHDPMNVWFVATKAA